MDIHTYFDTGLLHNLDYVMWRPQLFPSFIASGFLAVDRHCFALLLLLSRSVGVTLPVTNSPTCKSGTE